MSERALRLLVSIGLVFAVFIYFVSAQLAQLLPQKSPEEGKLGGPVPGLTRWQLAKFEEGRSLFRKHFAVSEGLGPLYNASSCVECHGGGGITGGAGEDLYTTSISRFAKRIQSDNKAALDTAGLSLNIRPGAKANTGAGETAASSTQNKGPQKQAATGGKAALAQANKASAASIPAEPSGKELSKLESQDIDLMENVGGPVQLCKSICNIKNAGIPAGCQLEAMTTVPPDADLKGKRVAFQLYGLGMVNLIPDQLLQFNAARQLQFQRQLAGKAVKVQSLMPTINSIGRFGAKCQSSTLVEYVAAEMATELGISNQLYRHTQTAKGVDKIPDCLKSVGPKDPNDDGKLLSKISFYLQTLAPPPRGEITSSVRSGESIFQQLNCIFCHTPQIAGPSKVMVSNPDGPPMVFDELKARNGSSVLRPAAEEASYVELRALESKPIRAYSDFLVHDMGLDLPMDWLSLAALAVNGVRRRSGD